jgi:hypothetical protein
MRDPTVSRLVARERSVHSKAEAERSVIMSRFVMLTGALLASSTTVIGLLAAPALASTGVGNKSAGHDAEIVGKLGVEGGAYPGRFRPTAGTVEVEFNSQPIALVTNVPKSGKFTIKLSPGSYTLSGCGPEGSGNQCSQSQDIKLTRGEVDHVQLVWAHLP